MRRLKERDRRKQTLDAGVYPVITNSTKELLHKGWGSPRPPHKVVVAAPHQIGGSMTLPASQKAPRGRRSKMSSFGSLKNHSTKAQGLAFSLTKS